MQVTGYRLYEYTRNGGGGYFRTWLFRADLGTSLNYTVTGLTTDTSHTYAVTAVDAAGNESARSNAVRISRQRRFD